MLHFSPVSWHQAVQARCLAPESLLPVLECTGLRKTPLRCREVPCGAQGTWSRTVARLCTGGWRTGWKKSEYFVDITFVNMTPSNLISSRYDCLQAISFLFDHKWLLLIQPWLSSSLESNHHHHGWKSKCYFMLNIWRNEI